MALFDLVVIDRRQHTVVRTGPDTWDVSSATSPGDAYEVRRYGTAKDRFACRCRERFPSHRPAKDPKLPCRHARAVAALLGQESADVA